MLESLPFEVPKKSNLYTGQQCLLDVCPETMQAAMSGLNPNPNIASSEPSCLDILLSGTWCFEAWSHYELTAKIEKTHTHTHTPNQIEQARHGWMSESHAARCPVWRSHYSANISQACDPYLFRSYASNVFWAGDPKENAALLRWGEGKPLPPLHAKPEQH